jgi:hypothetical protein
VVWLKEEARVASRMERQGPHYVEVSAENRMGFHGKQDAQWFWLEVYVKIQEIVWLEGDARAFDRLELQG